MRRLIAEFLLFMFVVPIASSAFAPVAMPDAILNAVAAEAMCSAGQSGESAVAREKNTAGLVEAETLPSFDFPRISQADAAAAPGKTTFRDHALIVFAMLQSALQGRR